MKLKVIYTAHVGLAIFFGKVSALKSRMQYILLQKERIIAGISPIELPVFVV